jgi:mono/diheme cytochrome c family protein
MSTPRRLLRMRRSAGISLTALCLTAFAAYGNDADATAPAGVDAVDGATTYAHLCQGCHMSLGQGAVGAGRYPALAGNPALVSWQYVALTVLNGKNGMPPFGQRSEPGTPIPFLAVHLSDGQVAAVVNYVRTHFGNRWKSKVTAREVAALPHP